VVLSFALPLPVITLIMFTSRRDLMGSLVNTKLTTVLASLSGAIILLLNIVLLYLVFAPLLGWWQPS
jgi:manganese transport protein